MNQGFERQRFLAAYRVVRQAATTRQGADFGVSAVRLNSLSKPQSNEGRGQEKKALMAAQDKWQSVFTAEAVDQRLSVFESVGSTNQTTWALMAQGTPDPIVLALSQTAGRGQWGRQWQSERGGLYLSMGVCLELPVADAAELTLCVAWGLAMALRLIPAQLSGVETGIPVQLKWLNDLVLQGRKLGGILTETRIQQHQITQAVIGVGVNWTNPVPETGINLQTFLAQHPTPLIESLEMLTAIALHGIFTGLESQQMGRMAQVRANYLALLAHRDRPIQWEGKEWAIVGIAPTGALRVQPKFPERADDAAIQPCAGELALIQPGTISLGYPL